MATKERFTIAEMSRATGDEITTALGIYDCIFDRFAVYAYLSEDYEPPASIQRSMRQTLARLNRDQKRSPEVDPCPLEGTSMQGVYWEPSGDYDSYTDLGLVLFR